MLRKCTGRATVLMSGMWTRKSVDARWQAELLFHATASAVSLAAHFHTTTGAYQVSPAGAARHGALAAGEQPAWAAAAAAAQAADRAHAGVGHAAAALPHRRHRAGACMTVSRGFRARTIRCSEGVQFALRSCCRQGGVREAPGCRQPDVQKAHLLSPNSKQPLLHVSPGFVGALTLCSMTQWGLHGGLASGEAGQGELWAQRNKTTDP
jgi:hypothetical protein